MSYIDYINPCEKTFNKKNDIKSLTNKNSPISLKKGKYIESNQNNYIKMRKIKVYKASSKKNKKNISNEDSRNDIKEEVNSSFRKEKKPKKQKKHKLSARLLDESGNNENSILLEKLKNIQVQTNLIKDELKKYKHLEKNLGNKETKKKDNNLIYKNNDQIKDDDNEKSKKIIKIENITINVINDNKSHFTKKGKKLSVNNEKVKNKTINTDYIHDYFSYKNTPTINNKFEFKKNELKSFQNSKLKNKRQNSATNREKYKIKKNILSPNCTYNIRELNKSKDKSIISNDQSFNNINTIISPIKKFRYKGKMVQSDKKINGTKIINHKKENNQYINLSKLENKEKLNQSYNLNKSNELNDSNKGNKKNKINRMKLCKSVEEMEKVTQKKVHKSKVKNLQNLQDISLEYYNKNINNEKEKPKEKEILNIEKLCRKGYSGDGTDKPNQDNYFIYTNFNNNSNNIYMGICDGHGLYGHEVSSFLVTNLPLVLGNFLRIFNIKDISSTDYTTLLPIISSCCIQINKNLSLENKIDCTLSGSTCVSLIYTPKKVFCINIGDSRCIIGKYDGKNWKSKSLSTDHKPELKKEKQRILKNGGEIRKSRNEDGEFIGPDRVWVKDTNMPGLAMTRSFGDEIAHQIGVICDPEIIEYEFKEEDKFIIIASDGIWQFISSQECVDIVKDFYVNENYKGVTKHLYKESCKRWLNEDDSIDDITLIIVFFK